MHQQNFSQIITIKIIVSQKLHFTGTWNSLPLTIKETLMISWVVYTVTSSQTHQHSLRDCGLPWFVGEAIDLFRSSGNLPLTPASTVDLESHHGLAGQSATSVITVCIPPESTAQNVNKLAMFIDVIAIISHSFIKICQVWDNFKNIICLYCTERSASQNF